MPKEFEPRADETYAQWWARVNDQVYDPTQDSGILAVRWWDHA